MDEPTNHLDIRSQKELIDYLNIWSKEEGHSVIGVFHDMNLALKLADYMLVLDNGKCAGLGKPEEIIADNLLNKVYKMDVVGYMVDSLKDGKVHNCKKGQVRKWKIKYIEASMRHIIFK